MPAHAVVVGGGDDRERSAEPEPGDPHARDVGARVAARRPRRARRRASRRSRSRLRTCPVPRNVNVSAAHPASRAMRSHETPHTVLPTAAAPPGPRGNPGRTRSAGHACEPGRPREVRAEAQTFRSDLLQGADSDGHRSYPDVRDRHHAHRDPGAEGVGGDRARAARGRADRRPAQGRAARRRPPLRRPRAPVLALPDRRAPAAPSCSRPRTGTGSTSRPRHRSARRSRSPGWADVTDVATISEPEHLDALDSKSVWTDDYAQSRLKWKSRDPLWVLVLRVHRLDEPVAVPWDDALRRLHLVGRRSTACPPTSAPRRPNRRSPTSRSRRSARASATRSRPLPGSSWSDLPPQ